MANFELQHQQHETQKKIDEEFENIAAYLNTLIQFKTDAPNSSDKAALIVFSDGATVRLYVQGERGESLDRKFKTFDNV